MKARRLIFIECAKEADSYLCGKDLNNYDDIVIAMNPSCYCYLKTKGIDAKNTIDYFDNESHFRSLEKSDEITKWLRQEVVFFDPGTGVKEGPKDMFIYWTRFAVHKCLWMAEIITKAADLHKPSVICASVSGKSRLKGMLGLYLEPEGKHLGRLAEAFAKMNELGFEDFAADFRGGGISSLNVVIKFALQYGRFELWKYGNKTSKLLTGKEKIYLTTQNYNFYGLFKRLKAGLKEEDVEILRGVAIPYVRIPEWLLRMAAGKRASYFIKQMDEFRLLGRKVRESRGLFNHRDLFFGDMIAEKIEDSLADYILGLMYWSLKLDDFIGLLHPKAFISNGNRADDVMLAEICNKRKIPVMLISHGSHVRPKTEMEKIEWGEHGKMLLRGPYSHIALQSPLAEGYLETFPSRSVVLKTGPLIWGLPVEKGDKEKILEKMFKGEDKYLNKKVVLHAGTPKTSKSIRFTVYETSDEYLKAIFELAKVVEALDDAILIVKFRPSPEISVEDIKKTVPFSEKVILSVEEPFLEILAISDLLVSFSSTAIEEALQNRIPVLQYGGDGRYRHVDSFEIKERAPACRSAVFHAAGPRELSYGLRAILELGIEGEGRDRGLFDKFIYPASKRISLEKAIEDAA